MAGNLNSDSTIWVIGEATGVSGVGAYGAAIPADIETDLETYADAAVGDLRSELVASGVLP